MINPIDPNTAKRALEQYVRGLFQDFYNETGLKVTDITIHSQIEDNKWQIKDIQVTTDMQLPVFE